MQDRIPTPGQEGRVLITPENGSAPFYAKVEMADNPTQDGDALNKENLLQDATCGVLSIPTSSVPNDAFLKLALGVGKYGYAINVLLPNGAPVPGAKITGAQTPDGLQPVTNDDGLAVVVSTEQEITIGIESPYIDIQSISSKTIQSTGILTEDTVTLQTITVNYLTIESSGVYRYSNMFSKADIFLSAGGGGGGGSHTKSDPGGGGGAAGNAMNIIGFQIGSVPGEWNITIGAGGIGGRESAGGNGGDTTIIDGKTKETLGTVSGGTGGQFAPSSTAQQSNNGNGGFYHTVAGDAQIDVFNDSGIGKLAGGGGAGGYYATGDLNDTMGGSPFGGNGGNASERNGKSATGIGGGGGGAARTASSESTKYYSGGSGGAGIVFIRFYN